MDEFTKEPLILPRIGKSNFNFRFTGLVNYLDFIRLHYNLSITIKDSVNFIHGMDKEIVVSLIPYLSHRNSYCSYIKSDDRMHKKCLYMACLIEKKLVKDGKAFFGVCHAGMGEFILPIFYENKQLLGFITIGPFKIANENIKHRIHKLNNAYGIDYNLAMKYYSEQNLIDKLELYSIIGMFEIVAEHISLVHNQNILNGKYIKQQSGTLREEIILNKTLEYIHQNFKDDLCLQNISEYCNCSKSYISHIFKKTTSLSLSEYTIRIRIREARKMLVNTDETVTNIALLTGFNDSNYFAKVFKKLNDTTPNEFRKSYR